MVGLPGVMAHPHPRYKTRYRATWHPHPRLCHPHPRTNIPLPFVLLTIIAFRLLTLQALHHSLPLHTHPLLTMSMAVLPPTQILHYESFRRSLGNILTRVSFDPGYIAIQGPLVLSTSVGNVGRKIVWHVQVYSHYLASEGMMLQGLVVLYDGVGFAFPSHV